MLNQLNIAGSELSLLAGVCLTLLYGVFAKAHTRNPVLMFITFFALLTAGYFLIRETSGVSDLFGSAIHLTEMSRFAKLTVLALFVPFYLVTVRRMFYDLTLRDRGLEYTAVALLALIGMLIMISANHLIAFYLGLELQSLALYIMVAFVRDSEKASEAALKYLTLGAVSSGLFLYGASLLYGAFGSLDYAVIAQALSAQEAGAFVTVGAVLVVCVFLFKLGVAPFHAWAPDVYQGSGFYTVMFVAGAPKIAAAFAFATLLSGPFYGLKNQLDLSLYFAVCATLVIGAVSAVRQNNLNRMLAFSAVTHAGYMMLTILASDKTPNLLVLEYPFVYAITIIGLFTLLEGFSMAGEKITDVKDLSGLAHAKPKSAALLSVFLLALGGLPPFAGFIVKFKTLSAALEAGLVIPVTVAVLASAISLFYYLRVIRVMYFEAPADAGKRMNEVAGFYYIVSGALALAVTGYILFPQLYTQAARLIISAPL